MMACEVKKIETVKKIVDIFSDRYIPKYHNTYEEGMRISKWNKTSLYEVYKRPSQTKIDIENYISNTILGLENEGLLDRDTNWSYSGNCNTFSMWIDVITKEGRKIGLKFTKDYLHIVGYDY